MRKEFMMAISENNIDEIVVLKEKRFQAELDGSSFGYVSAFLKEITTTGEEVGKGLIEPAYYVITEMYVSDVVEANRGVNAIAQAIEEDTQVSGEEEIVAVFSALRISFDEVMALFNARYDRHDIRDDILAEIGYEEYESGIRGDTATGDHGVLINYDEETGKVTVTYEIDGISDGVEDVFDTYAEALAFAQKEYMVE